jgi:hypothetical protein
LDLAAVVLALHRVLPCTVAVAVVVVTIDALGFLVILISYCRSFGIDTRV